MRVLILCISTYLFANLSIAQDYQVLTAQDKVDILWSKIEDSAYTQDLPTQGPPLSKLLSGLLPKFLHKTFQHNSDFLPDGRKKLIHPYGTVAKVRFQVTDQIGQTGVLSSGGIGLLRASTASQSGPFSPGIGLKIMISETESINFLALYSLDGQGDNHDFFAHPLSNIIPWPKSFPLQIGALAFRLAIKMMGEGAPLSELNLPLHEASSIRSNGELENHPVVPHSILFVGTREMKELINAEESKDFRISFETLRPGTHLQDVYLKLKESSEPEHIGRIILESSFVASRFGDEQLFFQHPRRLYRQ